MKTSLLCPEHSKSNPSPSTSPVTGKISAGTQAEQFPGTRPRHPARPEVVRPSPAFLQRPLRGTQATRLPAYPPLRSAQPGPTRPDPAQPQPRPEAHTRNRISKLTADSFSSAILAPPTAARPEVDGFPDDQANGTRRTGEEGRGRTGKEVDRRAEGFAWEVEDLLQCRNGSSVSVRSTWL